MRPGDVIAARFEVGRLAGSGGMGDVYAARDRLSGSSVAVKVLRLGSNADPDAARRFFREARVLSELRHPAIVSYVAHGTTPAGEVYLAMEWLEGTDLGAVLSSSRLPVRETIALVQRVAGALGAAHERGIIHRDVKPDNIFIEGGQVRRAKVLDFGLARMAEGARILTRTGLAVGTPAYMSPEQAVAEAHLDARSDVFSLGCVLFQCLTGKVPFYSEQPRAVLLKILHDDPPHVRQLRAAVPAGLDDLVWRMLDKDPESRPESGRAVASELDALQWDHGAEDVSIVVPTSITRSERRLTCFIVMGDPGGPVEDLALAETIQLDLDPGSIRDTLESQGAELEVIADGSWVVTLSARESATDLAAQAAKCALAIRAEIAQRPIAVTVGRLEGGQHSDISRAAERAVELLDAAPEVQSPSGEGGDAAPIRLDDVVAGLLDVRFELGRDAYGYVLLGEGEGHGRPRTVLGKATPFVGRDRELFGLRSFFDECRAEGVARVVLVSGAAGSGKSRLCYEFVRGISDGSGSTKIWRGRGQPASAGAPFAVLKNVIRSAACVTATDPAEVARNKIARRIDGNRDSGDTDGAADFLALLAGVPIAEETSARVQAARQDPALMTRRIRQAWEAFLEAECSAHPVVLILEDIHWGDLPTVELIDDSLRRLEDKPLFVVATARPGVSDLFPGLWAERGLTQMRLSPLTRRASETILRTVLGDEPSAEQAGSLIAASGGNPFFLEEVIRAFPTDDDAGPPETLIAMVQSRIERLDPECRRVLRAASVFGIYFQEAGVRAILGAATTHGDTQRWLDELVKKELLDPPPDVAGVGDRAFRQSVVRHAAYAMLTDTDRKTAHALAAGWLEQQHAEPSEIAHHHERAGQTNRAIEEYLRAAEAAYQASDLDAVLGNVRRGAALGAEGPALGALREVEARAHLTRGEVAFSHRCGAEAVELLKRESALWVRAAMYLCTSAYLVGDHETFERVASELLALSPEEDESRVECVCAMAAIGSVWLRTGDHDRARAALGRAAELGAQVPRLDLPTRGRLELALATRAWLVDANPWSQLLHARRAIKAFSAAEDRANVGYATVRSGVALITFGANEDALELLRDSLAAAESSSLLLSAVKTRPWYALALAYGGAFEEARVEAAKAVEAAKKAQNRSLAELAESVRALVLLLTGDAVAAVRQARAVVTEERPRSIHQAEALVVLGAAHLALGEIAESARATRQVMQWLEEGRGVGHLESLARITHVEAIRLQGDIEGARRALESAHEHLLRRAALIEDEGYRAGYLDTAEHARILERAAAWGIGSGEPN